MWLPASDYLHCLRCWQLDHHCLLWSLRPGPSGSSVWPQPGTGWWWRFVWFGQSELAVCVLASTLTAVVEFVCVLVQ